MKEYCICKRDYFLHPSIYMEYAFFLSSGADMSEKKERVFIQAQWDESVVESQKYYPVLNTDLCYLFLWNAKVGNTEL